MDFAQFIQHTQQQAQKQQKKKVVFMKSESQSDSVISEHQNQQQKQKYRVQALINKQNIQRNQQNINQPSRSINNKAKQNKKSSTTISSTVLIRSLFSYIKRVKLIPTLLVQHLLKRQKKYDQQDQHIYYPFYPKDLDFSVKTISGKNGIQNLIRFLQDMQSKQTDQIVKEVKLAWSNELHQAAMKRAQAIQTGNNKVQNLDIGELVSQFGYWRIHLSEIIVYGFIDPKQILIEAFLEDGSQEKNNREEFFNELGKYVGIGMASHPQYQVVTVMIFAGGVTKLSQFSSSRPNQQHCQCNIF